MSLLLSIILFAAALVASFFGLGGGVLYTPIQLWFKVPFNEASSTSLLLILITSFSATIVFRHKHRVDWKLALLLEIPTTAGAFIGGILSEYFSSNFLTGILILLLLLSAFLMIRPPEKHYSLCTIREVRKNSLWFWKREWNGNFYYLNLRCVFPIMFIVGTIISIVGISGGVIKIPIMVLLLGIPMPIAIGSSAFMVGLTALAGLLGHASIGHVNWHTALLLAVPVFIGAQIGSRASVHIKTRKIKHLYGWFLIIVAIVTFLRAWGFI